jgi:hypothetical protein
MAKDNSNQEEFKDSTRYVLSKFEYDLYHDEDNVALPSIRFKRFGKIAAGETWKFFHDQSKSAALVIDGTKLTLKEREFLRTVEGVNFALAAYKAGANNLNAFKKSIKEQIKK